MATWTKRIGIALAVGAGLVMAGGQGACTSVALPPVHGDAERVRAESLSLPYAVAVERGDFPPVYAERLVDALRASGLFAEVELAERRSRPAQLVARVLSPSEGAAVIPIFTALTLGLFPTWADETWGLRFSLASADAPDAAVVIDFRWSGTTVLGWASALLNLSPNRAGENPSEGPRFAQHVAVTIAAHAAEIEAFASPVSR